MGMGLCIRFWHDFGWDLSPFALFPALYKIFKVRDVIIVTIFGFGSSFAWNLNFLGHLNDQEIELRFLCLLFLTYISQVQGKMFEFDPFQL